MGGRPHERGIGNGPHQSGACSGRHGDAGPVARHRRRLDRTAQRAPTSPAFGPRGLRAAGVRGFPEDGHPRRSGRALGRDTTVGPALRRPHLHDRAGRPIRGVGGLHAPRRAGVLDGEFGGARTSRAGLGRTAGLVLPNRPGRVLVGHNHLGAGQRRRHHEDPGGRRTRRRRRFPSVGRQALWLRFRYHQLHDHHRQSRGSHNAHDVFYEHEGCGLGWVWRDQADRRVGRPWDERHPEPRLPV